MWWRFYIFVKSFFVLRKSSFPSWPCRVFFEIFLPQPPMWCFQLIFIIQYAVRKIFLLVCSVFIIQKVYTSWTSTFNYVNGCFFRDPFPSFTKKACKFIIRGDQKIFFKLPKKIKRLQQNAFVKLRFADSDSGQVYFTKIEDHNPCFEHNIFHNNFKYNVYGQVFSYKYCKLLQNRNPLQIF